MAFRDIVDKAEDALKEHDEQVRADLDTAAAFIKSKTDDAGDVKVDEAVAKAKQLLDEQE
jgi:hypothetical protein